VGVVPFKYLNIAGVLLVNVTNVNSEDKVARSWNDWSAPDIPKWRSMRPLSSVVVGC
jgi:hypothetical protein